MQMCVIMNNNYYDCHNKIFISVCILVAYVSFSSPSYTVSEESDEAVRTGIVVSGAMVLTDIILQFSTEDSSAISSGINLL